MENQYDPRWAENLRKYVEAMPSDVRGPAIQQMIEQLGKERGITWEQHLQQLHSVYLSGAVEKSKQRWDWLKALLECETYKEQTEVLFFVIEAMADKIRGTLKDRKVGVRELLVEDNIRAMLITRILFDAPSIAPILAVVQENIERQKGLPQGSLTKTIAVLHDTRILHLHIRVQKRDRESLSQHIQALLGTGTLLTLEVRGQPENERTLYYQQKFVNMPCDEDLREMTDERLLSIIQRLSFDTRVLAIQHTVNQSESIVPV